MIDNKTTRLLLPLPNPENFLEDDVGRIQQSLEIIDRQVATVDGLGFLSDEQIPEDVARLSEGGKLLVGQLPTEVARSGVNSDITNLTGLDDELILGEQATQDMGAVPLIQVNALLDAMKNRLQSKRFISGLNVTVTPAAITVSPGEAYLPSLGALIQANSTLTVSLSGVTFTASTWYHVYLFRATNGAAAVDVTATAPEAYAYPAHQKTGDATRRYLASFRVNAAGTVMEQVALDGIVYYESDWANTTRILTNGMATTPTALGSAATLVPSTATLVDFAVTNTSTANATPALVTSVSGNGGVGIPPLGAKMMVAVPVRSYPNFYYRYTPNPPVGSGLYVDVGGYRYAR